MSLLTISIQQPEHFPWLGFFNKIVNVDKIVVLDNVQFKKRYFENRTRIRNKNGRQWLRIPVKTKGRYFQKIADVEIDNLLEWRKDALRALELNYKKSPYFREYFPKIKVLYEKEWSKLADFNITAIKTITGLLGVDKEFMVASDLKVSAKASLLIYNICKKIGANIYLSGKFGQDYLDEGLFRKGGIRIIYQDFHHPLYRQFHERFIKNMSTLDLLFNEGERSLDIIKNGFVLKR